MNINKTRDVIIITIMVLIYFVILGFGKYMDIYEPYDFMSMSNERQIAGAAILIYIGILDGYVVFVLIAGSCFLDKDINMKKIREKILNQKNNNKSYSKNKKGSIDNNINGIESIDNKDKKLTNKNNTSNEDNWDMNSNENIVRISIPKVKRQKLKPIEINKNKKDNKDSN